MSSSRLRLLVGAVLVAMLACSASQNEASSSGQEDVSAGEPVARIGDETLTVEDLDAWIKDALFQQATGQGDPAKTHDLRRRALDQMVRERLVNEAARQHGMEPSQYLAEEVGRRSKVSDEDVKAYYEAHKDQYANVEFDKAAPAIRRNLERSRQEKAVDELLAELRADADVELLLTQPRVEVAAVGPAKGPEDAPIVIVEFSDYQCPFCQRAEATVHQLLEKYPDQVRFVYRHFPLDSIHPRARAAAEAAACADEQGRFWEFHELVFANPKQLSDEDLVRYAEQAGLDTAAFQACVKEGRTRAIVARDIADGRRAGVSGTPAFFVNGIRLTGAQPLSAFEQIIQSELAQAGGGQTSGSS